MSNPLPQQAVLERLPDLTKKEIEEMGEGEIIVECKAKGCRNYKKFANASKLEEEHGVNSPQPNTVKILQTDEETRYHFLGLYNYCCSQKCKTAHQL